MRHQPDDMREPAGPAGGFPRGRTDGHAASSRPRWLLGLAMAGAALIASGAEPAQAQLLVDGRPDAVRVEVDDVPLQQVLAALQAKYNLHYRTDDALDARKSGTFSGPLRTVTARILDGYDFAMKITPQGIDVLVLRQHPRRQTRRFGGARSRVQGVAGAGDDGGASQSLRARTFPVERRPRRDQAANLMPRQSVPAQAVD